MLIGGIEAGGTKMVCALGEVDTMALDGGDAVGAKPIRILERIQIPTEMPERTIPCMIDFFAGKGIEALGIGCFGPVDLNLTSQTYGYITKTPKAGWMDCNIVGAFQKALGVPVGFDTDVNAAALGEVTFGAARNCETAIYITVGTGVGVGVYCNGSLLHGLVHPEAGHILLQRHPKDTYKGRCPFHVNCLEGLASGPAVEERWGKPGIELADREEVWEMEAYYIAQAVANYILAYSPQKIILGGGIMHQKQLFPLVQRNVQEMLGGYVNHPLIKENISEYITAPALGENPGIMGAFELARRAFFCQKEW